MNPDEAYKSKIGERLTRTLADGVGKGEINEEEASEISTYILENIDKAENNLQLLSLLEELAKKWPVFEHILTLEQAEITDKKEDAAVQHAENLIKENKLDEALSVVGNMTNKNDQVKGED